LDLLAAFRGSEARVESWTGGAPSRSGSDELDDDLDASTEDSESLSASSRAAGQRDAVDVGGQSAWLMPRSAVRISGEKKGCEEALPPSVFDDDNDIMAVANSMARDGTIW
jgi:hypothetical protein